MTIVKTHTGTVITKDGPQVKNCTSQSGCGLSAKTSFTTKKPGAVTLQKYAPPAAARHHQAYRGEACLNRTKRLFHRLRNISCAPAGVCSCRKRKRVWRKKSRFIPMTAVMLPFLTRRLHQLLTIIRGSLFFRASQSSCTRGAK